MQDDEVFMQLKEICDEKGWGYPPELIQWLMIRARDGN